ncbi:MAG: ABC transporter permease [Oscillospiraceae bacterium]|jgi:peptide/nickel transport system permease protein|nr:ABC transporter permease [Oscillospiraceae bacterium]
MKTTFRQIFRQANFVIGFSIITLILLVITIYPLFNPGSPLQMIGQGTFFKPGTYVNIYDSLDTSKVYTLRLDDAAANRIGKKLLPADRETMRAWLIAFGLPEESVQIEYTDDLLQLWWNSYDENVRPQGMTSAARKAAARVDAKLAGLYNMESLTITQPDETTGEPAQKMTVSETDYVNVSDIANVRVLPLGTDNFGRDTLKELLAATATSLKIGLLAGCIATLVGLALGLFAGYVGGIVDDIIMFFANLFTVIPGFVLLILISYSIGQESRGATTVAVVIGFTSWVWTTRSVRAQVLSLRNRDHVNLSKLSGHSLIRILVTDILPYIASYVVMALILQICSGILSEAQLSMLGLGPKTTEVPTLGLMMFWGMQYTAHLNGAWWAYFPVIVMIALISFSLNLMNTGLDQVFNPQLRS